jgi:hypothetical protein
MKVAPSAAADGSAFFYSVRPARDDRLRLRSYGPLRTQELGVSIHRPSGTSCLLYHLSQE